MEDKKGSMDDIVELQAWEKEIPFLLRENPKGFLVSDFLTDDIGHGEDYIQMDGESLGIMGDKKALVMILCFLQQ